MGTCRSCTLQWGTKRALQNGIRNTCDKHARKTAVRNKRKFWNRLPQDWASKLAATWKLSPTERNQLSNIRPKRKKREWERDLTQEGIHPHPGPNRLLSKFTLAFCNSDGLAHAYSVMDECTARRLHCFAIAEVRLNTHKGNDVKRRLSKQGYRAWLLTPDSRRNHRGKEYWVGGILVAVRNDVRAHKIDEYREPEGESMLIDFEAFQVALLWRRPTPDAEDAFATQIHTWADTAAQRDREFLAVGDWNWTPGENPLLQLGLVEHSVRDKANARIPSRWEGDRCIDYLLANFGHGVISSQYLDLKAGDHKILQATIASQFRRQKLHEVEQTARYERPETVEAEDWRRRLAQLWNAVTLPECTNTETEWAWFCTTTENVFRQTQQTFEVPQPPVTRRPKGTPPRLRKQGSFLKQPEREGSFKQRKLANFVGRLSELHRQTQQGKVDAALHAAVQRTWPKDILTDYRLENALVHAKEALEGTRRETHQAAVAQWREKLNAEDKYLTRWIKQDTQCLPASVTYQGVPSKSHDEALRFLLDLWKQVWERDLDCQARRNILNPPVQQNGRDVSPIQAARVAEGAAGPDGWSAAEITHLPRTAWEIFLALWERWTARNQYPEAWRHIRMSMIPIA